MSASGWPLPLAGPWPRVGTPGHEEAGGVGVQARPRLSPHLLLRGPVGTHPPHGRPEALRQAPQTAQVPLEATQFEGGGLGPSAGALRGLGGRGRLLPPPQASSCHKEQVTQEQLHGLGVVGRAGVRGAPALGGEGWGPAVPGAGSGLHCRGTAPASLTCNATAMHRGAARLSRPPHLPPATGAASKEGSARPLTLPLLLGVGKLRVGAEGWPLSPGPKPQPEKQGEPGFKSCTVRLTPQSSATQGRRSGEWKGGDRPPDLRGPRHQPSPCQWSRQLVWWPGCPAGTRWPSHRWPGWPDQTLPSCGPGRPGQP